MLMLNSIMSFGWANAKVFQFIYKERHIITNVLLIREMPMPN
jgi:hypothetical protein